MVRYDMSASAMTDDSEKATGSPTLLLVDDDKVFVTRLARAMEARGYQVTAADSISAGLAAVDAAAPDYAVIDMRLGDGSGLDVIARLHERKPDARAIVLTGYGNIASAVTAVKLGAYDYLAKPADADDIHRALMAQGPVAPEPADTMMSADRVRWEHIQRVYELCGHNVSETARRLSMHRRTLQRILSKRAPR